MAFPAQTVGNGADISKRDSKLLVEETAEVEELELQREEEHLEEDVERGTRVRYVPLCDVYSATSPSSKKVKARKLVQVHPLKGSDHRYQTYRRKLTHSPLPSSSSQVTVSKPPIIHFYSRRRKRKLSFFDAMVSRENVHGIKKEGEDDVGKLKRRRNGCTELMKLGVNSNVLYDLTGSPRVRLTRNIANNEIKSKRNKVGKQSKKPVSADNSTHTVNSGSTRAKRWLWLCLDDADPKKFIGLQCKVYWPLDDDWYLGRVVDYNSDTGRHHVEYGDGDEENLIMSNERIKFHISFEEMKHLNLTQSVRSPEAGVLDIDEMVVLAASLNDCQDLEPGDVIWAKLTGHAMWPAIVLDESLVSDHRGLNRSYCEKSIPVQFFGTHDFARVKTKQIISFLRGLLCSFHLKCKKLVFVRGLEEAKLYLSEQKLPKTMLHLRNGIDSGYCPTTCANGDDGVGAECSEELLMGEGIWKKQEVHRSYPIKLGDLQVISLGKIVKDSVNFRDERFIWPEGYTAMRKFPSVIDPLVCALYKMEVVRDTDSKILPLFRVTSDNGEQFEGCTPSACWDKIYKRLRKMQLKSSEGLEAEGGLKRIFESGSEMFGFSHPEVFKLVQELSHSKLPLKLSNLTLGRCQDLPVGYRPVHVKWKDLDKCNVCHMDEEYENNLFLQCDKCRMMVHARCYGELEPVDGILWLCNLCRPGAPEFPPPCCLCPVIGGAMKPTTDGRWAHLACAIWIPETCLSDVKKMEPIDGLNRIHKNRWKLLCRICGVSYGACIQCSNNTCCVAYHPLCARAAGFCVELEDEDRLHLIPLDEDEEDQCIRLLSFCKKHRLPSNERSVSDELTARIACLQSDYTPPPNPSGCARSEPYNYFGRRGRKEPEALAAASLKRLFVENRPYMVGGYCSQHESSGNVQKLKNSSLDLPKDILSMAEKYKYMKETFRKRLAFGKSGIHGFGIFAKHSYRAGDMVIEYTGELVRPPIADRREHLIYNSLVGAGTYMFRFRDERVIDATRAGSIAHLINHSCEPNCYSRDISVNGDEHIIIFAKRDIKQWEELTYDYRFFSIDEQLACYCGFPRCRGVVNDVDADEQAAKLYAPRSELIDWREE